MKTSSLLRSLIVWAGLASFPLADAAPVTVTIDSVSSLAADYSQSAVGGFSAAGGGTLTGATGGLSFNNADFAANLTNGTTSTTDASTDAATFQMTVEMLQAHSGSGKQWLFEVGGSGTGMGIHYSTGNLITFLHRRSGGTINRIEFDATALIAMSFDVVASISPTNFLRLFVGGDFVEELMIATTDTDWDGGNAGAFGREISTAVEGGVNFASGTLRNFKYFHDVLIEDSTTVTTPAPLALLALTLLGFAARRWRTA